MSLIKPPKTLWQAIELALHDEALVHRDERYEVDMGVLHAQHGSKCVVCFAGSVMAKTLGADHRDRYGWDSFGEGWKRVFLALDYVRRGLIADALDVFHPILDIPDRDPHPGCDLPRPAVTNYAKDRAKWRLDMHRIKRQLKARGL